MIFYIGVRNYIMSKLEQAVNDNDKRKVARLLKAGANLNIQNRWGCTPLLYACIRKNYKIIELLLEAGANPNTQNDDGITPLHWSSLPEITELLLKAGANPNIRDKIGWTPLHNLCNRENYKIINLLLNAGADPNIRDKIGWTPLQYSSSPKMIELLLNYDANTDININKSLHFIS